MVLVRGAKAHRDRLKRIRASTPRLVTQALYAAGQMIEIEAERSITEGSISGAGHIPSLPGEPPNADTRLLDTSIETVIVGPGRVDVSSNAPYSAALEFGTSRMEERPFMRPALAKIRNGGTARKLVANAVKRSTGGGVTADPGALLADLARPASNVGGKAARDIFKNFK